MDEAGGAGAPGAPPSMQPFVKTTWRSLLMAENVLPSYRRAPATRGGGGGGCLFGGGEGVCLSVQCAAREQNAPAKRQMAGSPGQVAPPVDSGGVSKRDRLTEVTPLEPGGLSATVR